jgi:phosphoribulokinase
MKKNAFLLIASAVLFACSSSENENVSTVNTEEIKVEEKKEVIKDYDYYVKRIGNDNVWMQKVEKQALERGISLDSMLHREARFMANYTTIEQLELTNQINKIKDTPEWMQKVEKQALERGISIDTMIYKEAMYMINNRK